LQKDRLFEYFLLRGSAIYPKRFGDLKLGQIKSEIDQLNDQLPKVSRAPTVQETQNPRTTHIQVRGVFNNQGDIVEPNTPNCLPPFPTGTTPHRLRLAQWLVAPDNPLTSRVTVNRVWQEIIGQGLVFTSDDFGSQGDLPTHPELLDWLAAELMYQNWSVKRIQRRIVTSATYRQSSNIRPELTARDPNNKLLARQSGLRLTAEAVWDCTLSVGGLLQTKIGGPSVLPPQDKSFVMGGFGKSAWEKSTGENRCRRALYTFIRSTTLFPQLTTFDAPSSRDGCTRRERSNTPLQALTLLNDQVFLKL